MVAQSSNVKLVFKVICDQDMYRPEHLCLFNVDRIICLYEEMSIIIFE